MRIQRMFVVLLVLAVAGLARGAAAQERSPAEVRLQAAVHAEEVEGNLARAIELYRDVIARYARERDVAARALLYLGRTYEKQGSQEATRAYQRIVREYGDQSAVAAQARSRLAALETASAAAAGRGPVARQLLSGEDTDINNFFDMVPSPDGRRVAYTQLGTDGALYVRDLGSGRVEQLAPGLPAVWNARPAWSPDGTRLAFSENGMQSRRTFVRVMDLATRSVTTVAGSELEWTGRAATPAWMPIEWSRDGRFLLVSRGTRRTPVHLAILPVAGGPLIPLSDSVADQGGAFSPDGRYVVYAERVSGSEQLVVHPVDGGERRQLTSGAGGNGFPLWSPDGRAVAYRRSDGVWVVPMDGGAATGAPQLVYPGEAIYPAVWTAAGGLYLRLYTTVTLAQQVAVDPQTGVPVRVEELPQAIPLAGLFAWSPDRQRIAFNGYDGDRMILRILAVGQNSTTSYSLFAPGERLWRMYWSADGRELHYTSMRGLRALDPASGQSRVVVDQGGAGRSVLHQSADGRRTLVSVDVMQPDSTPLGVMVVETGQTRGRLVAPSRSADGLPRSPWVYSQLSPQGDLVLFGRQANLQTGQSSPGAGTLWVVGSDASGLRQLGTVDLIWSAVWAPTGRFIAYTGSSGGRAVARIVDVASGAERDVTLPNPRAEQVIASDWSRDGRLVGLVSSESRYGFWVLQRLLDHPR